MTRRAGAQSSPPEPGGRSRAAAAGDAQPGPQAVGVRLGERNELLPAAGFAPLYPERALDDDRLEATHQALETTLRLDEPFPAPAPAPVPERPRNVVLHNAAVDRLVGLPGEPARPWKEVDPSGTFGATLDLTADDLRPELPCPGDDLDARSPTLPVVLAESAGTRWVPMIMAAAQ